LGHQGRASEREGVEKRENSIRKESHCRERLNIGFNARPNVSPTGDRLGRPPEESKKEILDILEHESILGHVAGVIPRRTSSSSALLIQAALG
jgi:hypothetical protein